MKYLIVQDWASTHGNHAGMVHMCRLFVNRWPDKYEMVIKPQPLAKKKIVGESLVSKIRRKIEEIRYNHYLTKTYTEEYIELCQPIFNKLKDGDEIFLLEYLLPWAPQYGLAKYIRKHFPNIRIYALSHLTTKYFEESIVNKEAKIIKKWSSLTNRMLTLGSSLSKYLVAQGVPSEKVSTGFHYVDSDYYHVNTPTTISDNAPITIIAMGALQRDYSMLAEVVRATPDVRWIICKGRKQIDHLFPVADNVMLKGYMDEDELRHQMGISDVSLNVMDDTVGSNVITTSMSMGLAMIVTDVGSIRDYCDEENALFCQNEVESIVKAINHLNQDRKLLNRFKQNSLVYSNRLRIEEVDKWFSSFGG